MKFMVAYMRRVVVCVERGSEVDGGGGGWGSV